MNKFCFRNIIKGNGFFTAVCYFQRHLCLVGAFYDSAHPVIHVLVPYAHFTADEQRKFGSILYVALHAGGTYFHLNVIAFFVEQLLQLRLKRMMCLCTIAYA